MLFRNVRYEDNVYCAGRFCLHIVTVVINPADFAVFADNAVFHMIHPVIVQMNLINDGLADFLIIIRMNHSAKGTARKRKKLFPVFASKQANHCIILINQFFCFIRLIDKEAAGHVLSDDTDE